VSTKINQNGSAFIGVILVVLVFGAVIFAGYKVYSSRSDADNSLTNTASTSHSSSTKGKVSSVPAAPQVSSASDLDKATQSLDATDPAASNSTDTTQLDSQTNGF